MPQVIVGAAVSALASSIGTGFALSAFAASFAKSLILGGLSYALAPKPKKPPISDLKASTSTVAVRQADLTRQHIYGHTRITRGYAHMQSTGINGELHLIMMLCEGELRAINEVWVNDYCIPQDWIDVNGNVTQGRYAGKLVIRKHLGSPTQTADTLAVTNLTGWTSDHRLRGIAYLYLILTKDQDVYPTGVPNFTAVVEGPAVYDPRVSTERWTTNLALFSHDFIRNDEYGFGAFSDDVDEDNVSAQANICDEMVDVPSENFTVDAIDTTTNIITLDGDINQLQFGDRVTVQSSGTLPGGLVALTNYFVIPYQIKTTPRILLATTLENAMAKTAIDITSAGTGSITVVKNAEPRYHGSGAFDTETNLSETLNNLVTCMAGRAVNIGGKWTLLAGAWRTPAMNYTEDDIRGEGYDVTSALSMSESYNVINGLFISPLTLYQSTNYPSVRYQDFVDDDNGIESPRELNLAFQTRPAACQRIAKIELFRGRQDITYKSPFSLKARQNQPGDNIGLTLQRLGWNDKYFEITEQSLEVNDGAIVSMLSVRETAQEIFDWAESDYLGYDPAPNTDLPDPYVVPAPTGVSFDSIPVITMEGDTVYKLVLAWDLSDDIFVQQGGGHEIQFKKSSDPEWGPSYFPPGELTFSEIATASVGELYDVRIRARNKLLVRSAWVTLLGVSVGSSGGVDSTEDWRYYYEIEDEFDDWGDWTGGVTDTPDWGTYS